MGATNNRRDDSFPAQTAQAITPDDANNIPGAFTKGVWIGGTGDLAVIMVNDTASVVLPNVQGGSLLPIRVKRILATGTTATGIVALI